MKVRVLGPVEALGSDGWEAPSAEKRRCLLAALAVNPNRLVTVDALVDVIWGDRPPRTAAKVVQNLVLSLRGAYGQDLVHTRSGGYLLGDGEDLTDAQRFEVATDQGRNALERSEPAAAVSVLTEANRLWRGTPFADLPDWTPARSERARLEELHALAAEDLLDALIGAGRHEHAVPELQAAVIAEPLRERRWALLMVALDRSGRTAEALRAYQRARTLLREELGIEPGPLLKRLDVAIATRDDNVRVPTSAEVLATQRALAMAHLGVRQRLSGDPGYRVTLHRAAELAALEDDHEALVEATVASTRLTAPRDGSVVDAELVSMLESALARVEDDASRARLLSTLAQELAADPDHQRRHALADEALACARRVGQAELLTQVLARRPIAFSGPDYLADRLASTAENLQIAAHSDDLNAWWTAAFTRLAAAVQSGRGDELPIRLEQLRTATAMTDGAPHQYGLRITEAWIALLHGELNTAERLAIDAYNHGRQIGEVEAFGVFVGQLITLRRAQGRLAELAPDMRAALSQPAMNSSSRPIIADVLSETGDHARAVALLEAEMTESVASAPQQFLLTIASAWARVAARSARLESAELLLEVLDPHRSQIDFNGAYVAGAIAQVTGHLRAALGLTTAARADLKMALELHRALDAPVLCASNKRALDALGE